MRIHVNTMPSGSMTGTAVLNGTPVNMRGRKTASYQMVWTGTPTGVFTFQICNQLDIMNPDGTVKSTAVWTNLPQPSAFTAQQPAGAWAATVGFFGFADLAVEWIRPVYTNGSSTGAMTNGDLVAS